MQVPFFGNDRQFNNLKELIHERTNDVWKTGQYLNGPAVAEFEKSLAKQCDREFALALNSCTDALSFALSSFEFPSGSEILVTNFSFLSSATSILKAGLVPVFCDVDPDTMMVTNDTLADKLSEKTKGVLVVSLFGSMAPFEEIIPFCQENKLVMVEDAAQSFGASSRIGKAGSLGAASCLSFDPTKLLHGTGAGGALVTNNEAIYEHAKKLRLHGRNPEGEFELLGNKSLLSTHDAAVMNAKLAYFSQWIERRNSIAKRYIEACTFLKPQLIPQGTTSTFHKFVLRCRSHEEREALKTHLIEKKITPRVHYGKAISSEALFKDYVVDTPSVEELTKTIITLPLFQELTDEEVQYVCDALTEFQTP